MLRPPPLPQAHGQAQLTHCVYIPHIFPVRRHSLQWQQARSSRGSRQTLWRLPWRWLPLASAPLPGLLLQRPDGMMSHRCLRRTERLILGRTELFTECRQRPGREIQKAEGATSCSWCYSSGWTVRMRPDPVGYANTTCIYSCRAWPDCALLVTNICACA